MVKDVEVPIHFTQLACNHGWLRAAQAILPTAGPSPQKPDQRQKYGWAIITPETKSEAKLWLLASSWAPRYQPLIPISTTSA